MRDYIVNTLADVIVFAAVIELGHLFGAAGVIGYLGFRATVRATVSLKGAS